MTDIIKSIGPGLDYADLNAWDAAAPLDMVAAAEHWIAEFPGHVTFSSQQTIRARTTSANYHLTIRAAANKGTFNPDFVGAPLYFDSTKGGAITSNASGTPAIKINGCAYTVIQGLQIKAANSAIQQAIYSIGTNCDVSRNVIERNATDSGVALLFQSSSNLRFHDNVLVSTGTASAGMSTDYSTGVEVTGNTFYAPNGTSNVGMYAQSGMNPLMRNNLVIGFTPPMTNASSSSSNNGTNAASLPGTSNQLNLVAANVFTSTTDLRLKAGAAVIGAGVTISGDTTDILGQTLASPPSIGAIEAAAAGATTGTVAWTESLETFSLVGDVAGSSSATLAWTESLETFAVAITPTAGTITTHPFMNNTEGTTLASLTGLTATVLKLSDMSFVKVFTGATTGTDGRMTLNDNLLVIGTQYAVAVSDASGTLGIEKYTAA